MLSRGRVADGAATSKTANSETSPGFVLFEHISSWKRLCIASKALPSYFPLNLFVSFSGWRREGYSGNNDKPWNTGFMNHSAPKRTCPHYLASYHSLHTPSSTLTILAVITLHLFFLAQEEGKHSERRGKHDISLFYLSYFHKNGLLDSTLQDWTCSPSQMEFHSIGAVQSVYPRWTEVSAEEGVSSSTPSLRQSPTPSKDIVL